MSVSIRGGKKLRQYLAGVQEKAGRRLRVDVGFFANATYIDGTKVAEVAAKNEFGGLQPSPSGEGMVTVPARPFMRTTVAEKSGGWGKLAATMLKQANGDEREALQAVGDVIAGQIRNKIETITEPPLAAYTLEQRRKKGYTSDKPLEMTHTMLGAVKAQVSEGSDDL